MIEVDGVAISFGRQAVLEGVSFRVTVGEVVALVGENGAGKSTVVACLAGLLTPDRGSIAIAGEAPSVANPALGVVWQNLALCDNLDVVANLYLGRERGGVMLDELGMQRAAAQHLHDLGIRLPDLRRPVGQLSGGQRQLLAIARALLARPRLLVLDEPTAALGVHESAAIETMMRRLRSAGVTVLLISHRIEQVFALADRVLVLRQGRLVADVSTVEVHPDDVVGMIAGVVTESAARRQLQQLHSLVDQLAAVDPSASIPLIVSSLSASLGMGRISLHLLDGPGGPSNDAGTDRRPADAGEAEPALVCRAALGLHPALHGRIRRLAVRPDGAFTARVAATASPVILEDTRREPDLAAVGIAAAWAVPIVGSNGLQGVLSVYADAVGTPSAEQLELALLHAHLAAAAIEREQLFEEVSRRNRNLESLRAMLDSLAGPGPVEAGLGIALHPLCRALGAGAVALIEDGADGPLCRLGITADETTLAAERRDGLTVAAAQILAGPPALQRARLVGEDTVAVPVMTDDRRAVLAAWWSDPHRIGNETLDLLDDAARSLALAIEREMVEEAHKESETLRRANRLQREFLHRLSHELRTPLTAIHGYADTLRQTDVAWDGPSQQRFLASIVSESARMRRLVADLLDTSALEGGGLRLHCDWCDAVLVVESAVACVPGATEVVKVLAPERLAPVWADHDRLEQVVVNLVENSLRHGRPPVEIALQANAGRPGGPPWLELTVRDGGDGFDPEVVDVAFEATVRRGPSPGAGLGLTIVRGIVEAHGGTVEILDGAVVAVRLPLEPT